MPTNPEGLSDPPTATASVEIAAPPESVYALVTDLAVLADLAAETVSMRWTSGEGAVEGAVFRGRNRNGWHRWSTACRVVDADPGVRFAFDVTAVAGVPVARWSYDLEPLPDAAGCRVTESTWDRRPGWFKRPGGWAVGVTDRTGANQANIVATLQRLKARAERA